MDMQGSEGASATPVGGAPAASGGEPTPAPAPAPAAEAATEATVEATVEATTEATAEATVEAAPRATADSWDWDSWDGQTLDSFPEEHRAWITKAAERQTKAREEAVAAERERAERWQRMFNDSLDGDDPRVAEALTAQQAAESARDEAQRQAEEYRATLESHNKAMEAWAEENTDNYMQWFSRTFPDIAKDEAKLNDVVDTAEELGVQFDFAANLMNMGPEAMKAARDGAAQGIPPNNLMRWVELSMAAESARGKPAARKNASETLVTSEDESPASTPAPKPTPKPAPKHYSVMDQRIREALDDTLKEIKRR
jgi:hypothetical protein